MLHHPQPIHPHSTPSTSRPTAAQPGFLGHDYLGTVSQVRDHPSIFFVSLKMSLISGEADSQGRRSCACTVQSNDEAETGKGIICRNITKGWITKAITNIKMDSCRNCTKNLLEVLEII